MNHDLRYIHIRRRAERTLPPLSLGYVNLLAVAVITPFTMYFATWGARIAHAIPMRALRICFGLFLAITAIRMFLDLATA